MSEMNDVTVLAGNSLHRSIQRPTAAVVGWWGEGAQPRVGATLTMSSFNSARGGATEGADCPPSTRPVLQCLSRASGVKQEMRPECSRVGAVFSWRNRQDWGDSSGSLRPGQGSPTAGRAAPSTLGYPSL